MKFTEQFIEYYQGINEDLVYQNSDTKPMTGIPDWDHGHIFLLIMQNQFESVAATESIN